MERKTLLYWLAQIGGWSFYFVFSVLLLISANAIQLTNNLIVWVVVSILSGIFISHAIRLIVIKWNWISLKLGKLILYSLAIVVLAATLLEVFQYLVETSFTVDWVMDEIPEDEKSFDLSNFLFGVSRSMILFFLWLGFYYVFVIIEKSRKQEILNLQWEASNNEIELKNLRAQLNPHFLFNSLNSIRALVGLDPEQAKSAITKLSGLLRHSMNMGKSRVVSLKEEMELVENYLQLEQIRFEERLKVSFDIDGNALNSNIPPLMLQTIIENGIKHGISKSIDGGEIQVKAKLVNNTLTIEVRNTGELNHSSTSNGIGLINTERRLNLLYGEDASMDIRQDNGHVKATIKITYK